MCYYLNVHFLGQKVNAKRAVSHQKLDYIFANFMILAPCILLQLIHQLIQYMTSIPRVISVWALVFL